MFRGLALSLFLTASAFAADDRPIVLITDVVGGANDKLEPFIELQGDTELTLGASDEIEFVHYVSCTRYRLRGGKVALSTNDVVITDGEILQQAEEECPRQVAVAGDQTAGVVFRSSDEAKQIMLPIRLVVAGPGFERASGVIVMRGNTRVARRDMDGRGISLNSVDDNLSPGTTYDLILFDTDGRTIGGASVVPRIGDGAEGLLVMRVE